jgi:hypothetical protein
LALIDFKSSDATFLTSAHLLVTPVVSLDNAPLPNTAVTIVRSLRNACAQAASSL